MYEQKRAKEGCHLILSFAFKSSCKTSEKLIPLRSAISFSQLGMAKVFLIALLSKIRRMKTVLLPLLILKSQEIPQATKLQDIHIDSGEFANLVRIDLIDGNAVKRTVSIPKWMDDKASEAVLSLSKRG